VTQQNAALVEEAAAAAESLQEQAGALTRAVAVFRVAHDTHGAVEAVLRERPTEMEPAEDDSEEPMEVERRGPNRAKNVARLKPGNKAADAEVKTPALEKTGTDQEWSEF
jgi:hypothetical protein